jgi:hypothetical protein
LHPNPVDGFNISSAKQKEEKPCRKKIIPDPGGMDPEPDRERGQTDAPPGKDWGRINAVSDKINRDPTEGAGG